MRWDRIDFEGAALAPSDEPSLAAGLPDAERAVMEMALAEGPRSAQSDTPLRVFARILFGFPGIRPLANDRLEAIRRFAVAAWFTDKVPERLMRGLSDAGVSADEIWRLLAYVAIRRGKMPEVVSPQD